LLAGFGHAGAILFAGLTALAADREILRALKRPRLRAHALTRLQKAHLRVFIGLGCALLTGSLMLSAQLATLPRSPFFWLKVAGLLALVWNGRRILKHERWLRSDPDNEVFWQAMRAPARTSALLWCTIALLGVLLTTV